jgi:hypothetical protein
MALDVMALAVIALAVIALAVIALLTVSADAGTADAARNAMRTSSRIFMIIFPLFGTETEDIQRFEFLHSNSKAGNGVVANESD